MPDDDVINKMISNLQDEEIVYWVLGDIRVNPTGDVRLLPYLEALLNSKSITLLGIPFSYGELRWLAAHALAAERKACGILESVILYRVMKPMTSGEIMRIAKDAEMPSEISTMNYPFRIKFLMEKGKMPLYDVEFLTDGRGRILREYTNG